MNANIRTIGGAVGAGIMASVVTSVLLPSGYPAAAGYTRGFALMAVIMAVAGVAALAIPTASSRRARVDHEPHVAHAELAIVPAGTITEG